MATYSFSITLDEKETGTSGHYPVLFSATPSDVQTYNNSYSMYFKQGDTFSVTVNNPSTQNINCVTNLGNPDQADPDPSSTSAANNAVANVASGTTFTYTNWQLTNDDWTRWGFFGRPLISGGGYKYSGSATFQKVSCGLTSNLPLDSSDNKRYVARGGSITFTATSITGLGSPAGSDHRNRLYIKMWRSGTPEHYHFGSLAKVSQTSPSVTVNVASDTDLGDWTAYIGHYNPFSSGSDPASNPYYGSNNHMASYSFKVTAGDTDPDPFSFDANVTGASVSTQYISSIETLSGIGSGEVASISPSNCSFKRYNSSGSAIDSLWQNGTNLTISNGQKIQIRVISNSSYSQSETGTITIGTQSASFVVTTMSDPGGAIASPSGVNYGLEVLSAADGSGNQVVTYSPSYRTTQIVTRSGANGVYTAGGGTWSSWQTVNGMTAGNTSTFAIVLKNGMIGSDDSSAPIIQRGTNQFRIQNNLQYAVYFHYEVVRL